MRYVVDRMTMADIPRIAEIERLSYSTPWPPSAYRKELQENPLAHYIVVRDTQLADRVRAEQAHEAPRRLFPLPLLPNRQPARYNPHTASIVGFAGLWLMVDEGHVTTIATHPDYRGRGLGELLLSSLISIAYDIHARMVTLEVRVSNSVAQNLYRKYGFREAGIRRRYYSDNNEDAYIMWTDEITGPAYQERFLELRQALERRLSAQDAAPGGAEASSSVG
jgi:ribosomal-protein-alanine N-acetyltransferase